MRRARVWRTTWVLCLIVATSAAKGDERPASVQVEAGLAAYEQGAFEDAVLSWSEAARVAAAQAKPGEQLRALELAARANSALGRHRTAIDTLQGALKLAEKSGERGRLAAVLGALGSACIVAGESEQAHQHLQRSLALGRAEGDLARVAAALNDLGNLYMRDRDHIRAINAYHESAEAAHALPALSARARVNAAAALREAGRGDEAASALRAALAELRRSPASHETAMTWIRVGLLSRELRGPASTDEALLRQAWDAFSAAAAMAESRRDLRAASWAWGYLGTLYEDERRYGEALELTRRAIAAAQRVNAPESLYRWQWQAGRLLRHTAGADEAISAYRRAVHTLQPLRPELSAAGVPFRDAAGRVYFELVDLLLARSGSLDAAQSAAHLAEARDVVELLKAAELRDYFRDECVDAALAKATTLDSVSPAAVVIYPVLLEDRTELLLTLPGGLRRVSLPLGARELTDEIRQFRHALEKRTTREYLVHAQRLYRWLIGPLEAELAALKIDTLVFVPDGALRTIPMAALHDGERFLIEKYALAITPGLSLTEPRPLARDRLRVLALGVTQSVQGYAPLPNVSAELAAVRGLFESKTLVDDAFSLGALERELKAQPYSVVHLASHGEFHGEMSRSFVLAFQERLTLARLEQAVALRRFAEQPLELLTLSACDTAAGDDRAALGLAGIAIKAGARSALATLWAIQDELSSALVAEFYRQIKDPTVSRARALQRAQTKVISDPRYDHPGFWSPFLVINNWL